MLSNTITVPSRPRLLLAFLFFSAALFSWATPAGQSVPFAKFLVIVSSQLAIGLSWSVDLPFFSKVYLWQNFLFKGIVAVVMALVLYFYSAESALFYLVQVLFAHMYLYSESSITKSVSLVLSLVGMLLAVLFIQRDIVYLKECLLLIALVFAWLTIVKLDFSKRIVGAVFMELVVQLAIVALVLERWIKYWH